MLLAVESHPAMLLYLDNARSIGPNSFAGLRRYLIIGLAAKYKLPAVYYRRLFATSGGLISYGSDRNVAIIFTATIVSAIAAKAATSTIPVVFSALRYGAGAVALARLRLTNK